MNKLTAVEIKAMVLEKGVVFSDGFLKNFGMPFLQKRRAYGNSDEIDYINMSIPQEFYLLPSKLICAVNTRNSSSLLIDYSEGKFILRFENEYCSDITFPFHPSFYDTFISSGTPTRRIGTLYGGGALGLFVYGNCALVQKNIGCHYCSIKPNKNLGRDFAHSLNEEQVYEAVCHALKKDPDKITQVMINGGIFKDYDRGFSHYIKLCAAAREALNECESKVDLHLISYPPNDLGLIDKLVELNVSLAMNSEVFNQKLFKQYCPGKEQKKIKNALKYAVNILGKGKVYSICVGGLEPLHSLIYGMNNLAEHGITPIINIFHPDPLTELANIPSPSADDIMKMGEALQDIYDRNPYMRPFYDGCGRNSIDSEAFKKLFKEKGELNDEEKI